MAQVIRVSHILVGQRYEAEDVLRKLHAGESFQELARKFSTCASRAQGGDLGEVEARRLDETFREAAESLKPGELSPIVRTRFGYHLILRA